MEPMLTELTQLPKEVYDFVLLIEFTWLTQENHSNVSGYRAGSVNKGFFLFWHIEFNGFVCWF